MKLLISALLPLAMTATLAAAAPSRVVLRDVVAMRIASVDSVYLLHVDGYTFTQFGDLRAESTTPNQFGFPTFSIADDVAYVTGVGTPAVPSVLVTEFYSVVGSVTSGIATTVKVRHTVTTPCRGLSIDQCVKKHRASFKAMTSVFLPVQQ